MSKVKNENFITIQGWMVNELGLKGNELIIYALVYGFSQDGEQTFSGSLQYIADWTNSTKAGVSKALKRLVEKGFLEKSDSVINGVKFCEYHATKLHGGMQQSCMGYATKLHGGMQQSCTNNIVNNNIVNKDIKDIDRAPAPEKHKFGEFKHVLLSNKDLIELEEKYGELETQEAIQYLDEYLEINRSKHYANHALVMKRWVYTAVREKKVRDNMQNKKTEKKTQFDEWMEA